MKDRRRKGFLTGRILTVFLFCVLLGGTGCGEMSPGEETQNEISGEMSPAEAGRAAKERQNPDMTENRNPEPNPEQLPDREKVPEGESGEKTEKATEDASVQEILEIHFLDVGQGDCTLLVCGGEAMLIDAGDNDQGTKVQNYLQKQGVETLKYVICTHPDADHIGGIDVILYKFECETVFLTEEEKDTNTYRDVIDTMAAKGYEAVSPEAGQSYSLGDAEFVIVGPVSRAEGNNNSVSVLVTHGENRFLFTGDAEEEEEEEMVRGQISLEADVYKVGHHGSRTSSSKALLDQVKPEYAVISCGEGNSYGHPHAETLNTLRAMGVKLYRTDSQGSILLTSDGQELTWNCSPCEDWTPGEPTGSSGGSAGTSTEGNTAGKAAESTGESTAGGTAGSTPGSIAESIPGGRGETEEEKISYICNINTMKFHYPDCSGVDQMKESNKLPVSASREEVISQGYEPCKRCKP